jgi:hypothetical protein
MVMSAGGVVIIGLFVFLMTEAQTHPPPQQQMRIEVPIGGAR